MGHMQRGVCLGQRTTYGGWFSPSIMQVLGIESRSPGLAVSALTCLVISLALLVFVCFLRQGPLYPRLPLNCVVKNDLELLPLPPKCWDHKSALLCRVLSMLLEVILCLTSALTWFLSTGHQLSRPCCPGDLAGCFTAGPGPESSGNTEVWVWT